jgi:hypothetical protein
VSGPPPLPRRVTTSHAEALRAADELEELLGHLREIVHEVRYRRVDAYATLYDARFRLSRLVRSLGAGDPAVTLRRHDWGDEKREVARGE